MMDDTSSMVYQIPCKSCDKSYFGETCRLFKTYKQWHEVEVQEICQRYYTCTQRNTSQYSYNKSAITDHVSQNNHVIEWEDSKIISRKKTCFKRGVPETIHITLPCSNDMKRNQGPHKLSKTYYPLLMALAQWLVQDTSQTSAEGNSHSRKY